MAASHGIKNVVLSSAPTMEGSYFIQVQKTQKENGVYYSEAKEYCSTLNEDGLGWRLPTQIELLAIYINKSIIETAEGVGFFGKSYWASTRYNNLEGEHAGMYFDGNAKNNGEFGTGTTGNSDLVRCVRDKK